jgi:hypothetical protein
VPQKKNNKSPVFPSHYFCEKTGSFYYSQEPEPGFILRLFFFFFGDGSGFYCFITIQLVNINSMQQHHSYTEGKRA